jgi:Concanavalin A-like lectin/glucanases superfamily
MMSTYELICHQTYGGLGGLAVDVSGCGNHGQAAHTEFLPDGAASGSGAIRFATPDSRIRIPTKDQPSFKYWKPLVGIRIEVTARLMTQHGARRTLIAADNAFMLLVSPEGVVHGRYSGPVGDPPSYWGGVNTAEHSLDHITRTVSAGVWVNLAFQHDGVNTMELQMDGETVARRTDAGASVPGVGSLGVTIGNLPDAPAFLDGDIDEIKVWRLNPRLVDAMFFARPVSPQVADCMVKFLRGASKALEGDADCAKLLRDVIRDVLDRAQHKVLGNNPAARLQAESIVSEYVQLWTAGALTSPAMSHVIDRWCALLRDCGVSFAEEPAVQKLQKSGCLQRALAGLSIDCDPEFAAYIRLVIEHSR